MSQIELLLPKMGESVAEATIIKWVKKEGDAVKADEPIIEIATDKVDSEVPSPEDGVLLKCLVKEGDVVQVGQPIAIIGFGSEASVAPAAAPAAQKIAAPAAPNGQVQVSVPAEPMVAELMKSGSESKFFSPLVRNIAKAESISASELQSITGSGLGGRVTKIDILGYVENRSKAPAVAATVAVPESNGVLAKMAEAPRAKPAISIGGNDEIIEMAERMTPVHPAH